MFFFREEQEKEKGRFYLPTQQSIRKWRGGRGIVLGRIDIFIRCFVDFVDSLIDNLSDIHQPQQKYEQQSKEGLICFSTVFYICGVGLQIAFAINTLKYYLGSSDKQYQLYIYIVMGISFCLHIAIVIANICSCCSHSISYPTKIFELVGLVTIIALQLGITSVYVVVRQYIDPRNPLLPNRTNQLWFDSEAAYDAMPTLIVLGYILILLYLIIIFLKGCSYIRSSTSSRRRKQHRQVVPVQEMVPGVIDSERQLPES